MSQPERNETVVLALGNLIRSDDAIGLRALGLLQHDPRVPRGVSLVEGGTKGLELVPYVSRAARLLVLDAVEVEAREGTIVRMQGEDLRALPGSGSAHELALADILNALRLLGEEPREVVLLGVQPATTELGTSLSAGVEAAVPALVEAAVAELSRWAADAPDERGEARMFAADETRPRGNSIGSTPREA